MSIKKRLASIALFFTILATLIMSGTCFSVFACECGEYHEAPFHVGDDVITLTETNSGNGWRWDYATRTLTLTNANISNTIPEPFEPSYPGEKRPEVPGKYLYDKTQNSVILLPPNSTLILNGNNVVTPVEDDTIYSFSSAINCVGKSLTIKGGGSLTSNGMINAHSLVFDGVNVTTNKNKTDEYGYNGLSCWELHIKNSVVTNNANTSFVAILEMSKGVLYTKNVNSEETQGAIYFFKNSDMSKYDVKYKTATGYDGETLAGNTEIYTVFFEKRNGNNVPASDIVIKDKAKTTGATSSNKAPNSSKTSTPAAPSKSSKPSISLTPSTSSTASTSSSASTSSTASTSSNIQTSSNSNNEVVEDDKVKINYSSETFPAQTIVSVKLVSSGEVYKAAQTALSSVGSKFTAYDINAVNNDKKVQPNGKVNATFKIPSNYDVEKVCVYYVGDEKIEKIPSSVDKNERTVFAELSHFSVYAVVEENINVENSDNTIYICIIAIAAVVILALVLAIFLILRKQKINKENA